jgi:ribonuclease P protein component
MNATATPSNERFRRRERLRGRRNFARVFQRRCSAGNSHLVVYVARNDLEYARLGIIVSRKLGNAVARARVRRRIREFFRRTKQQIPVGYDYTCIAKRAGKEDWAIIPDETVALFARAIKKISRDQPR